MIHGISIKNYQGFESWVSLVLPRYCLLDSVKEMQDLGLSVKNQLPIPVISTHFKKLD